MKAQKDAENQAILDRAKFEKEHPELFQKSIAPTEDKSISPGGKSIAPTEVDDGEDTKSMAPSSASKRAKPDKSMAGAAKKSTKNATRSKKPGAGDDDDKPKKSKAAGKSTK